MVPGIELLETREVDTTLVISVDVKTDVRANIVVPHSVWLISDLDCNPLKPLIFVDGIEVDFEMSFDNASSRYTLFVPSGSETIEFVMHFAPNGQTYCI